MLSTVRILADGSFFAIGGIPSAIALTYLVLMTFGRIRMKKDRPISFVDPQTGRTRTGRIVDYRWGEFKVRVRADDDGLEYSVKSGEVKFR